MSVYIGERCAHYTFFGGQTAPGTGTGTRCVLWLSLAWLGLAWLGLAWLSRVSVGPVRFAWVPVEFFRMWKRSRETVS